VTDHTTLSRAEDLVASTEVVRRIGMSIVEIGPNRVQLRMPLQGNIGGGGVMYAGSLFALVEAAPGLLILNRFDPARFAPTCASVNIRFRRPAKSDVRLHLDISDERFAELEAGVIEKGKASAEFTLDLLDEGDEVVSVAEVKYVLFAL
jgi:acyl-coenzyme A thioesterase PaaI-like protein